jgi:DedD protein
MDRQLKARLIGAAVLVMLVVLLVPELLTGPKPSQPVSAGAQGERSTRSVTIELGGPAGSAAGPVAERAPMPPPVERTDAADAPPTTAPVASTHEAPPEEPAVNATVEAKPAAAAPPAPDSVPLPSAPPVAQAEPDAADAAPAGRGGWAVQVGAFSAPASARKLVQELESAGYRAYVSPVERSGKELHRVRVGPEPDRAGAERLAANLKQRGLPAAVVTND